jgi:hypothetical protein
MGEPLDVVSTNLNNALGETLVPMWPQELPRFAPYL